MGFTSKAASLFLLAGSLSAAAAEESWPTSTSSYSSSSSSSSSSTSSTWSTDPWTAWPAPTDPSSSTSSTSSTSYLAAITPCPWCPSSIAPAVQNVTQQLQTLSTCSAAVSACYKGRCHTSYPYSSWQWVSTTIPCSFNNFDKNATTQTGSSCLVTKTEDCVPVSEYTTTVTSYTLTTWTTTTYATITPSTTSTSSATWGTYSSATPSALSTTEEVVVVIASPIPVYEYIEKDYCAPFSGLGPLAMLDYYDGSGLCTTCGVKGVGLTQEVSATECRTGYSYASTSCVTYIETWTSSPVPPATVTATQVWSSHFSTDGSWDITFTGVVPAQTVSAPYGWVTSDPTPVPWAFHGSCSDGPTTIDFTTTVTTTITVSIPWTTPTDPGYSGWGDWTATGTATPTASATSVVTGYVQVADPTTRYRKHDGKYVSFSGEDGLVVSGNTDAATFVYDGGYLLSDGEYITCDGTGYSPFEKSADKPATGSWVVNGGVYGTLSCSSVTFCESGLGSLFIEYDENPSFTCPEVWLAFSKFHCLRPLFNRILIVVPAPLSGSTPWNPWTSSSTTTTATATTTSAATTTTTTDPTTTDPTPDPSSDPEPSEMPTTTPKAKARHRRRRGTHKKRHARH
jgi:hypothetical protein